MVKGKITLSIDNEVILAMKLVCAARDESVSEHIQNYMTEYVQDNYDDMLEILATRKLQKKKKK